MLKRILYQSGRKIMEHHTRRDEWMKSYSYHVCIILDDDPDIEEIERDRKITNAIGHILRKAFPSFTSISINPVGYKDTFIYKVYKE